MLNSWKQHHNLFREHFHQIKYLDFGKNSRIEMDQFPTFNVFRLEWNYQMNMQIKVACI